MARRETKVLSDKQLRVWLAAGEAVAKSDGDGLTFTLSANGTAAWILRYRYGARRRELTLGRYPDVSLKAARDAAAEARLGVLKGLDVAVEKQRAKADAKTAWTVREVVKDFENKTLPQLAASTQRQVQSYLDSDLLPQFGAWVFRDITADDAQAWLERIATSRSYQAAANARKAAVMIAKHALARRLASENVFAAVSMGTIAARPAKRQRVKLSDEELGVFLRGLGTIDEQDALIFRLLLLTGVRGGEFFGAEWPELDLDEGSWRIPRSRIKTRKAMGGERDHFEILLPPDGIAWFKRLRELAHGSRWVVPARARFTDSRPADYERVLDRLKDYVATLKSVRAITFHDLRSTMRSHLSALGVRTEIAERAINHSLGGVVEIYDRHDYRDERLKALTRWAATMRALEKGDAKVVPMQKRFRQMAG